MNSTRSLLRFALRSGSRAAVLAASFVLCTVMHADDSTGTITGNVSNAATRNLLAGARASRCPRSA